ncbi:MAG: hypothetical protein IPI88_13050 [Chitinophagaceae bacterium]|nr:hypothetical protein [Chitinophagaceae bacterium]
MQLVVENNVPPAINREGVHSMGIGIENVKQRLDLLYKGKYKLTIMDETASFTVNLQLQTK